jgi:hypothetical protein
MMLALNAGPERNEPRRGKTRRSKSEERVWSYPGPTPFVLDPASRRPIAFNVSRRFPSLHLPIHASCRLQPLRLPHRGSPYAGQWADAPVDYPLLRFTFSSVALSSPLLCLLFLCRMSVPSGISFLCPRIAIAAAA